MPGMSILAGNLLLVAGLLLWTRSASARQRPARLLAVLLLQGFACAYAYWRYQWTLPTFDWTVSAVWPWAFFSYEMLVLTYEVWSMGVLAGLSNHSPAADLLERRLRQTSDLPTVDVFIPTYSEGGEILEETIRAALALDYPRSLLRIWMLDDSRRPWPAPDVPALRRRLLRATHQ